jgi:hypothetical protein
MPCLISAYLKALEALKESRGSEASQARKATQAQGVFKAKEARMPQYM